MSQKLDLYTKETYILKKTYTLKKCKKIKRILYTKRNTLKKLIH